MPGPEIESEVWPALRTWCYLLFVTERGGEEERKGVDCHCCSESKKSSCQNASSGFNQENPYLFQRMPSGKVPRLRAEGHRAAAAPVSTHKSQFA